jgi:hypothetical protein|tara:strand:- start:718 stop:894 length:177 start_codon:yes stop_codon:yes gene_type:complete
MIKTNAHYEMFKALLEDNKHGNAYCRGDYLSDDVVAFVIDEIAAWEAKQEKLAIYRNS